MRKKIKKTMPTPIAHQRSDVNKAVFFNRDGMILNLKEDSNYIYRIEDVNLNENIISNLKRLHDAGYLLFIVTNQGGIAKGLYTHDDVHAVHNHIQETLQKEGFQFDKMYYCPHHESIKTCICRKPSPYMINMAIEEFKLDRKQCFLIGTTPRDIKSADEAQIKSFKLRQNQDITSTVDKILNIDKIDDSGNFDIDF